MPAGRPKGSEGSRKFGLRKLNKSISDLQELRKDLKAMDNIAKKELFRLYTFRRNYRPTIEMMERIVDAKADLIRKRKENELIEQDEQQEKIFSTEKQEKPKSEHEQEIIIRNE